MQYSEHVRQDKTAEDTRSSAFADDDGADICPGSLHITYYLFKKFNGRPPRGQSIAISSPRPDKVM